jgi:hypothetical protein
MYKKNYFREMKKEKGMANETRGKKERKRKGNIL